MSVDHVDLVTVDDKCEIRWAEAFGGNLQNRLVNRAARAELQSLLLDLIAKLDPFDREILVLRHVEELSNSEAAAELGLSKSVASKRYIRALERMRAAADSILDDAQPRA